KARSLVSETHVKRVSIHVAVHSHRADAHLFAGPDDSAGNLAAIGDQDLAEGSRAVVHKIEPLAVSSVRPERNAHRSLLTANWSGFRRGVDRIPRLDHFRRRSSRPHRWSQPESRSSISWPR